VKVEHRFTLNLDRRGKAAITRASKGGLLTAEVLVTVPEAKVLAERWREQYNAIRQHRAPGYSPPVPEAVQPESCSRKAPGEEAAGSLTSSLVP